jgi:hypothetical protein
MLESGSVFGCDWRTAPAEWLDVCDGHIPENLPKTTRTKLVRDLYYHGENDHTVHVQDLSVHSSLLKALYDNTVQESRPWGTYVRMEQVIQEWDKSLSYDPQLALPECSHSRDELALHAVAAFLHHAVTALQQPTNVTSAWSKENLFRDAHGVAVWALASEPGSQVPYHLDYAEQLRYESNIIVPPILAGTLQCTSGAVQGGAYCVHTAGLSHYQVHGYKGNKTGGHILLMEEDDVLPCTGGDCRGRWIKIPYRQNRMILQAGHLPHLSTLVESILPVNAKRVIIGFNVFRHNVGPLVERAPEHSSMFRRKVALQRLLLASSEKDQQNRNFSMQAIRSKPWLAKLLVRAKRQKEKEAFILAQSRLDTSIDHALDHAPTTAQNLAERFGRTDGAWPNATDVLVHIRRRCQQGHWCPSDSSSGDWNQTTLSRKSPRPQIN